MKMKQWLEATKPSKINYKIHNMYVNESQTNLLIWTLPNLDCLDNLLKIEKAVKYKEC